MTEDAKEYRFAPVTDDERDYGMADLSEDPATALLAICIADQQRAGFKDYLDLRRFPCVDCKGAGFNTGWGYIAFVCGAEITDGDQTTPCGSSPAAPATEE